MEFNPVCGKRLTAISVFEPWRECGTKPIGLPLFGAITLEFGDDMALIFKSPLRYARTSLHEAKSDLRAIVCDIDQLGFYQRMLEGCASVSQPCRWKPVLPESRHSMPLDNLPDLRRILGQTLLGMTTVSDTIIELRFSRQDFPIWLTYREDLDGAIQMAWAGWHHHIVEIVVSEPTHAFGWLHTDAPYPIYAKGKHWPNIGRYIESAAWQATRRYRSGTENHDVLLEIHEEALRLKFECYPQLARRFAAIRYPIVSDSMNDVAIQAFARLRAAHSTSPAS